MILPRPSFPTSSHPHLFTLPGAQSGRPTTVEAAVRTARTATARPVTSASGRFVRVGTASMLSADSALFINVPKLDLRKYAARPAMAKALFLYMLHVTNDTLKAIELAAVATEQVDYVDWWWKGVCR